MMNKNFKMGDIIKVATDDYYVKRDGLKEFYHYLILDSRKHYVYHALCLDDGQRITLNKTDTKVYGVKVA